MVLMPKVGCQRSRLPVSRVGSQGSQGISLASLLGSCKTIPVPDHLSCLAMQPPVEAAGPDLLKIQVVGSPGPPPYPSWLIALPQSSQGTAEQGTLDILATGIPASGRCPPIPGPHVPESVKCAA